MKFTINKISLLKFIDKTIGRLLVWIVPNLFRASNLTTTNPINKILIIRPGGIGDAVLLIPAIKILKNYLPGSEIDILSEKRNSEIFALCKEVSKVFQYDKDLELKKCLKNNYDIVIDTEQWHRLSAVVAYLTKAPIRVGYNTNERGRLFTHTVPYSHDEYEVYSFFNLIEPILRSYSLLQSKEELFFDPDKPFLDIDNISVDKETLSVINTAVEKWPKGLIAISPGATVRERRWGGDRYGKVAKKLSEEGYGVIIVGAASDRPEAEKILQYAPHCIDLTGKTDLKTVAYILKQCKLFIGPDSGTLHIAVGVGTPTVSLFGSGIQKKWGPIGRNHIIINKNLPCSPCTRFGYTPECRNAIQCILQITINEVLESAHKLLAREIS